MKQNIIQEAFDMRSKKVGNTLLASMMAVVLTVGLTACGNQESEKDQTGSSKETKSATLKKAEASELGNITDGKFVIGFDQNFPPMGFVDENGGFTGFDIEAAAEVASRLGLEFVPQPIAWDAKDMELSSGTIDCIWNGFTISGREDDYTWTDAYLNNAQVVVVRGDEIQSLDDLAGKIVEVQVDSSAEAALKENTELTESFAMLQTVADYNTAMMDLEQGAVDAIAMDQVVAAYQLEGKEGELRILNEDLMAEAYAIGFLKGNEKLRDNVQTVLEEMAADGTLKTLSEKWFGSDMTTIGK